MQWTSFFKKHVEWFRGLYKAFYELRYCLNCIKSLTINLDNNETIIYSLHCTNKLWTYFFIIHIF